MTLTLQVKETPDETVQIGPAILGPVIDEDYWMFRVEVSDHQAVVGFLKFGTVGIGFQVEDDWNTNLPYSCPTEKIYQHIERNRGDADPDTVREAIRLVQSAAAKFLAPSV